MACDHKQLRCTDNRFFCLVCGAEVALPDAVDKQERQEEKPEEAQKNARKRKRKESE